MSAELTATDVEAYLLDDVEGVLPLLRDPDVPEAEARALLLACLSAKYVDGLARGFRDAAAMVEGAQS